jgi:asparagine synthase (glutamine-hydrolysing)
VERSDVSNLAGGLPDGMSGICAAWQKENPTRIAAVLGPVADGLSLAAGERVDHAAELGVGVGVSARFGSQQILNTSRLLIACDTDLTNEKDLRREAGEIVPAPEGAETAALLAACYERWGRQIFERLRGAFSVVVWDRRRRELVAAIDHVGIHRLVYYRDDRTLVVASRLDALMKSGQIANEVNPRAIANVLNFSINTAPGTIFSKVRRLEPGQMLIAGERDFRIEKYWDMRYELRHGVSEQQLSSELELLVERSVATRCQDEFTESGAFLSGGTDSSTVVGMMARLGRGPAQAFSIGFHEQDFDELYYARLAAAKFGAQHHTYHVSADDCFDALPHMIRYFDEPFGNSSAIPTYFCARLAAQNGVKTLLGGDGGDELFGGNEAYRTEKIFELYQAVPELLRRHLIEPGLAMLPLENGLLGKARRYVRRSNLPRVQRMLSYHFLSTHSLDDVFKPEFVRQLADYSSLDAVAQHYDKAPSSEPLSRRLYCDLKTVLGDSDLPKVTRMSELAGIRARFPFLDLSVVEFAGTIPARLKVKRLEKRYLFKRAFRNLLPVEIIRKRKHGFGIPVAMWMKSDRRMRELLHDTLSSRHANERGYFRREFMDRLFRHYETDESTYYGDTLWSFLVLELWHRQFVDEPVRTPA